MKKILLSLSLLVGIAAVIVFRDQLSPQALEAWITDAGAAAPLLFMAIYAIGTVFFLPGSLLTLLGGALFGPWLGSFYSLTAATVGAMLSFLVARYLASDWVGKKAGGKLKDIVTGVENEGWRFVAFTRLVPLFPFNLLNYALGLTRIPFLQYSITTYICMLPGAVAYTWLGYAAKESIAGGEGTVQKIMLAIALLALVSFLPRLVGKLRRPIIMIPVEELKERMDSGEDLLLLDVRLPDAYHGEQGHIASATHIPLNELAQRLQDLEAWKDKPVVTICRTDRMSSQAAQLLAKQGFSNVKVARMGMTGWIKNAYPTQ